jgi:hypothetical protein
MDRRRREENKTKREGQYGTRKRNKMKMKIGMISTWRNPLLFALTFPNGHILP